VVELAALLQWRVFHDKATNAPRRCPKCKEPIRLPRNVPGFPDLLLVKDGRLIVAELKSETGQVSKAQALWLAAFSLVPGIEVAIWRPTQWDEIKRTLGAVA
jgi:hypothetical protein